MRTHIDRRTFLVGATWLPALAADAGQSPPLSPSGTFPERGMVPDEATALAIARAVATAHNSPWSFTSTAATASSATSTEACSPWMGHNTSTAMRTHLVESVLDLRGDHLVPEEVRLVYPQIPRFHRWTGLEWRISSRQADPLGGVRRSQTKSLRIRVIRSIRGSKCLFQIHQSKAMRRDHQAFRSYHSRLRFPCRSARRRVVQAIGPGQPCPRPRRNAAHDDSPGWSGAEHWVTPPHDTSPQRGER